MKALRGSNADRISDLPHEVMQRILTLLPVKDAAKTATLSKQWRHNWRANTELVFDHDFGGISEAGDYASNANKLLLEVYRALLVHDGPITKFMLKIPGLRPCADISHIVHFLAKKGIQELILIFIDNNNDDDDDDDNDDDEDDDDSGREMPSALFSARELHTLKMQGCDFNGAPSWFLGFSKLTHLGLVSANVDSSFYDDFLPKCPLLQHLTLAIRDSAGIESHLKAELVAPSLKVLETNVWNICFKHTPLLSAVTVEPFHENRKQSGFHVYNPDIAAVFATLPAIEELSIGGEWLRFFASGNIPFMLPTHLRQLKVLEITSIVLHHSLQARVLLCLIMSSPNLQRLLIWLSDDSSLPFPSAEVIDSLQLLLEAEGVPPASCFQCLEEFNMNGCGGDTQVELDLVRIVLTCAPTLRRIFIEPDDNLGSRKGLKFLKKVTRFKRASSKAEVIYV